MIIYIITLVDIQNPDIQINVIVVQVAEPRLRRRDILAAKLRSVCSRMCSLLSNLVSLTRFINDILMLCQFIGGA